MTLAAPSSQAPAFFGRLPCTLSDQLHLTTLIDSLVAFSAALEVGVGALPLGLNPRALVEDLARVLGEHFQTADQCLNKVAAARLDLLPAVVDMRADHASLLQSVADLRLLVSDEGRWAELPLRIARLLETLAEHRETETALIRSGTLLANVA
jgi:hypothetical protein